MKIFSKEKNQTCPECGEQMLINEWDGWRWICWSCDYQGQSATDDEIDDFETKGDHGRP